MNGKRVIAFTGGGTGGHIYPGLSVVEELRKRGDFRIVWIGSNKGMDRSIVEAAGIEFVPVPAGKLRRNLSLRTVPDAFRVLAGYFAARRALKKLEPDILFSKGGYVSVPPCAAARSLGIPVFTHESDLSPGLATRLNARSAERIYLSYRETAEAFPPAARGKTRVVGNPVRQAIRGADRERGRAFLGAPEGRPVLLAMGGSQGARQINELVAQSLPALADRWFVAHQRGSGNEANVPDGDGYRGFDYIGEELPDVIAAADLVVTRAGAGLLWECATAGKPLLLVPLCSSSTRGDQVENARLFASRGAAYALVGEEATSAALVSFATRFVQDPELASSLSKASREIAKDNAAALIADDIVARIGDASASR